MDGSMFRDELPLAFFFFLAEMLQNARLGMFAPANRMGWMLAGS